MVYFKHFAKTRQAQLDKQFVSVTWELIKGLL